MALKETDEEFIKRINREYGPGPKTPDIKGGPILKKEIEGRRQQLIEQNDLLLLQLQQNSLISALRSPPQSVTPPQPQKSERDSLMEAVKLIRDIQGLNLPADPGSDEDALLKEGIGLLKEVVAAKLANNKPPVPPGPPNPPGIFTDPATGEQFEVIDEPDPETEWKATPPWRRGPKPGEVKNDKSKRTNSGNSDPNKRNKGLPSGTSKDKEKSK